MTTLIEPEQCDLLSWYNMISRELKRNNGGDYKSVHYLGIGRRIWVGWLLRLHLEDIKLTHETLYLAINIIDRYLRLENIDKNKIVPLTVVCLFIAAKVEEVPGSRIKLNDFWWYCDHLIMRKEFISMELAVLLKLEFRITVPTSFHFLKMYLWQSKACRKLIHLSCYMLEVTMLADSMNKRFDCRTLAAGTIFNARLAIGKEAWNDFLSNCTELSENTVRNAAILQSTSWWSIYSTTQFKYIKDKYSRDCFNRVAEEFDWEFDPME